MAGDDMKLPLFQGYGIEDPKQYWFSCEAVWMVKQVQDEYIKKENQRQPFRLGSCTGT